MRILTVSLGLCLAALTAACGGAPVAPATPEAPAAPSAVPSAAPTAAPTAAPAAAPAPSAAPSAAPAAGAAPAWKDMSPAAKLEHMKAVVAPTMAKTFQAHDPKEFKEFGCKTCHGPNKESPKKFLPKLTFENGAFTSMKTKPAETKFMMEKVVPEMAKVMGEKPYDPQTHQGFGCGGCHTVDMKK